MPKTVKLKMQPDTTIWLQTTFVTYWCVGLKLSVFLGALVVTRTMLRRLTSWRCIIIIIIIHLAGRRRIASETSPVSSGRSRLASFHRRVIPVSSTRFRGDSEHNDKS